MILTEDNYFSKEASLEYMGVSQYKAFVGSYGRPGCEALAMARLNGKWEEMKGTALLVGSYVDSYFEGSLDKFKEENPGILVTRGPREGELKAEYMHANKIIERIERDPVFMQFMSGEKQVIMEAEIFGTKWKIKIDSFHKDLCIVDLKVMKSLRDSFWVRDQSGRMTFADYWGYNIQGAIYQEVVFQKTGKRLPFIIAGASKEPEPDIALYGFQQDKNRDELADALSLVIPNIARINDLKAGKVEPDRCEVCDYCKSTKVLEGPVHHSTVLQSLR